MPQEMNDRSILVKDFELIKLNIRLQGITRLLNAVRSVEMCLSATNTERDIVNYVVFCVNKKECSFFIPFATYLHALCFTVAKPTKTKFKYAQEQTCTSLFREV